MMTYQERQQYRELRERLEALRARLEDHDPEDACTRGELLEVLELVDATILRMSPQRWDRALEAIAEEAARRAAGIGSGFGGG